MSSWNNKIQPIINTRIVKDRLKYINYNIPKCNDIAVVMVFFNPASSIRIQQNILYVYNQLTNAKIPTFIGELCFNNDAPLFQESDNVFIFKSESYMFYKENLINRVIEKQQLSEFKKYVILDADIIFEEVDWLDKISEALNNYDIIQPYDRAYRLSKNFTIENEMKSMCKVNISGHPGYVWAFTRNWYDNHNGLFEYALIGGGDAVLSYIVGVTNVIHKLYKLCIDKSNIVNGDTMNSDKNNNKENNKINKDKVGYINTTIYHLPHGPIVKRQWGTRMIDLERALLSLGIKNIYDATEINEYGVIEWKKQYKKIMNDTLLQYFKNREDDNF
jgi:hypothetical protein